MKTILIAHNYSEISFASMSYHFSHFLAKQGHDVIFVSHNPYFESPQVFSFGTAKLTVMSWPTKKRPTRLSDFLWFGKIYLKYKPDVVIGHFVGSNITATVSKILSLGKAKTFEYYHTLSTQIEADQHVNSLKKRLLFLRKKMFYRLFCNQIICPSEWARNDVKCVYGIKNAIVLPNPMADRFVKREPVSDANIIISYLGRLDPSKGVAEMLIAFNSYTNNNPQTKMKVQVAGTGTDQHKILQLIENNKRVIWSGGLPYDKVDDYLGNAHFVIIPSKFDNLPTVGLEALMNGTALLISNTTGLTNFLADGKDCFKFDAEQAAMEQLFERVEDNFHMFQQMNYEARNTFLKYFSMEEYCSNFYRIVSV